MASAMQPTAPNRLHALATHLVVHQEVQWQILPGLGMAPYPHDDRFHCTSFEHYRIPSAADPEMHMQHDTKEDSKSKNRGRLLRVYHCQHCHLAPGSEKKGGGLLMRIMSVFTSFGGLGKTGGFAQTIMMSTIPKVDDPYSATAQGKNPI